MIDFLLQFNRSWTILFENSQLKWKTGANLVQRFLGSISVVETGLQTGWPARAFFPRVCTGLSKSSEHEAGGEGG